MKVAVVKPVLFIVISLNISIISGCFNSGEGIPYFSISEEFADYCWFEAGTSWAYQNDSTLAVDTVIVDEVDDTKRFNPTDVDYNYQAVEMFTLANNLGFSKLEITAGDYQPEPGEMNSLLRLYKEGGIYQLVFSPQYDIGDEIDLGDEIGRYTNIEIIENFELLGNIYTDVYHTRIIIEVGANIEYNFWIAKNFGIIKSIALVSGESTSISLKSANILPHN